MKRLFQITIKGKTEEWAFDFEADEKYWQDWLDDGLNVKMVMNIIPSWVAELGLTKLWCVLQDILQVRWL